MSYALTPKPTIQRMSDPVPDLGAAAVNAFDRILSGENVFTAVQNAATSEGERVCVEGIYQRVRENWPKVAIGGSVLVGGLIYMGYRLGRALK